jgi:hypothetical protein
VHCSVAIKRTTDVKKTQNFNNCIAPNWGTVVKVLDAPPRPVEMTCKKRSLHGISVVRKLTALYAIFQIFDANSSPYIGAEISEYTLKLHALNGLPANHLGTSVEVRCALNRVRTEQANQAAVR